MTNEHETLREALLDLDYAAMLLADAQREYDDARQRVEDLRDALREQAD